MNKAILILSIFILVFAPFVLSKDLEPIKDPEPIKEIPSEQQFKSVLVDRGINYEVYRTYNQFNFIIGSDILNAPDCDGKMVPFNETYILNTYNGDIIINHCGQDIILKSFYTHNGKEIKIEDLLKDEKKQLSNETSLSLSTWSDKTKNKYEWYITLDTRKADEFGYTYPDECMPVLNGLICNGLVFIDFKKAVVEQGLNVNIRNNKITITGDLRYIDPILTLQSNTTNLQDTYVDQNEPTSAYGNADDLQAQNTTVGYQKNIYTSWDISMLYSNYNISNAELLLYAFFNSLDDSTEGYNISATRATSAWAENSLTWVISLNISEDGKIYDRRYFFGGAGEPTGWQKWNVTGIIQADKNLSKPNSTIILRAIEKKGTPSSSDPVQFYSKDYSNTSLTPLLNITYTLTDPFIILSPPNNSIFNNNNSITFNILSSSQYGDTIWVEYVNNSGYIKQKLCQKINASSLCLDNNIILNLPPGTSNLFFWTNGTGDSRTNLSWTLNIYNLTKINITNDTYVSSTGPTNNYGYSSNIYVGQQNPTGTYLAYFKFNDELNYKTIIYSNIYFYISANSFTAYTPNLYKITSEWDESIITYNTRPSHNSTIYGTYSGNLTSNIWISFNISGAIREFNDKSFVNYGFGLINETSCSGSSCNNYRITPNISYVNITFLENNKPYLTNITISPAGARTNETLNCSAYVMDFENSTIQLNFTWFKDGINYLSYNSLVYGQNNTYIHTQITIPSENLTANDNWTCSANAYDGTYWSGWFNSSELLVQETTIDTTAPVIEIQSPTNKVYDKYNISLNYTLSELARDKCWYQNISGNVNISINNCLNTTFYAANGTWSITVYANDTTGNTNKSTVSFSVNSTEPDITAPEVNVYSPINGFVYSTYNISLNYSVYELSLSACWYQNISGNVNISLPNCMNTTFYAANGTWSLILFANDTVNNLNKTVITFKVNVTEPDITAPVIEIQSPTNQSKYNYGTIDLNYTLSELARDKCWYQNISGNVNISILNCLNTTINITSNGDYNIILYANDTTGNTGQQQIYFSKDNQTPTITLSGPINKNYSTTLINLNFVATDTHLDKCWYQAPNGTNVTPFDCNTANYTVTGIPQDHNIIFVYANDSYGNMQISSVAFDIDTIFPTVIIDSPLDGTAYNNSYITLTYIVNETQINNCWYQNISGNVNISLPNCYNSVFYAVNGLWNITVYANDTAGNVNSTQSIFFVNYQISNITERVIMGWGSLNNTELPAYMTNKGNLKVHNISTENAFADYFIGNGSKLTDIEILGTPWDSINTTVISDLDQPVKTTSSPTFQHLTVEGVTSTGATGTGKFVFDTSPTLITPNIGAATGTSLNVGTGLIHGKIDRISNTNNFGDNTMYVSELNNILYASDKRFLLNQTNFTTYTPANLFDNGYEDTTQNKILANKTGVLLINFTPEFGSFGMTYGGGYIYVAFYYTSIPENISARVHKYTGEWYNASGETNVAMTANNAIWRLTVPAVTYIDAIEITIITKNTTDSLINEVEYNPIRIIPTSVPFPTVNKFAAQSLYYTTTWKNASNVARASITPDGVITGQSLSIQGVTSTGATGTGKLVFDTSPTASNITTDNLRATNRMAVGSTAALNKNWVNLVKETFTGYDISSYNPVGEFADLTISPSQQPTSNLYPTGGSYIIRWDSLYNASTGTSPYTAELRGFGAGVAINRDNKGNLQNAIGAYVTIQHLSNASLTNAYAVWSIVDNNGVYNPEGNIGYAYNYIAQATVSKSKATIGSRYGFKFYDATGTGNLTSQYGIYIDSLSKATDNNFAIYLAGTGVNNGITLGTDTNIYRSAANTLKTDDSFQANSFIAGNGSIGKTASISVRKGDDSGACEINFVNGLLVSTTC